MDPEFDVEQEAILEKLEDCESPIKNPVVTRLKYGNFGNWLKDNLNEDQNYGFYSSKTRLISNRELMAKAVAGDRRMLLEFGRRCFHAGRVQGEDNAKHDLIRSFCR